MPLIGVAFAVFAILVGNILEGGHVGSLVGGPAALIVLGGTVGAVMVQYPFSVLGGALKSAMGLLKRSPVDAVDLLNKLVGYATQARKDGLLSLEKAVESVSDPFLKKALTMAIDGADSAALRETMETAIEHEEAEGEEHAKAFEAAGGYCPTIGIVGAVLGLIHVMSNLADINAVGTGIAGAFVATIYGVAAANIVFLPIAGRIKGRVKEISTARQMVLAGVLAVQGGLNPRVVRERLREYIPHNEQKKLAA